MNGVRQHTWQTVGDQMWDVVVIGAGPSGSMAAKRIAELGRRVLLVDKANFPRHKVCGCCLNHKSQQMLHAADMPGLVGDLGAKPIDEFFVGAGNYSARLAIHGSVSVSRAAFDNALASAAVQAGAQFLQGTEARLGSLRQDAREIELKSSDRRANVAAKVVVAADGVGSGLMRKDQDIDSRVSAKSRIGCGCIVESSDSFFRSGTIFMACANQGYVGLVRLEDGKLDVAAALDPSCLKGSGGTGSVMNQILRDSGFPEVPALDDCATHGTPLLTRHATKVFSNRVLLVGDAAGYVEPFTGEGIAWALSGGYAVATYADQAVAGWQVSLGEQWNRQYRKLVKQRQLLCRLLSSGLRSPRLTRGAVRAISAFPILARPFARALTSKPLNPSQIQGTR